MNNQQDSEQFTVLENKKIGRNLAMFRRLRNKKAFEVADYIGIGEPAYTKYERGEAKITVDFVQKVSEFLEIDPIMLLSMTPGAVIDSVSNSPQFCVSNYGTYSYQTYNEQQQELLLKLLENMTLLSQRMLDIMEKK